MLLSIPMATTSPLIEVAEPSRVMVAGWPTRTLPTSVTLTVVVASSPPAPSMTKSALVPLPWLPVTCCPGVMFTRATVPSIGATRVAAARFWRATLSWALAASRLAWSAASCAAVAGPWLAAAAEPPPPPVPPPEPPLPPPEPDACRQCRGRRQCRNRRPYRRRRRARTAARAMPVPLPVPLDFSSAV